MVANLTKPHSEGKAAWNMTLGEKLILTKEHRHQLFLSFVIVIFPEKQCLKKPTLLSLVTQTCCCQHGYKQIESKPPMNHWARAIICPTQIRYIYYIYV